MMQARFTEQITLPGKTKNIQKIFILGAAVSQLTSCNSASSGSDDRPNILFIMCDDFPNNALSCYGSMLNTTPNIDRIANEGMRFDNAFVTTSLSGPSRASILTGTYAHVNGQVTIDRLFDYNQPTFPVLLKEAGYNTAVVGKWHLWNEPQGFDYWNILDGQGPYFDPPMIDNGVYRIYPGYTTDVITNLALKWLKGRDTSKPFCLLYHHKAPHWIPEPDSIHENMYDGVILPEPPTFNDNHASRISSRTEDWNIASFQESKFFSNHPRWSDLPEGLSPEERKKDNYQRYIKDMLRAIASVDDNIGKMLDYLDESGLADNTVIIFTSDNGYFLGEHGWIDKKVVYDESLRIPLLVRWPDYIPARSVNKDFVLNVDFAPTFLDLAQTKVPQQMQGNSFKQLLKGISPEDWRKSIYVQFYVINQFPYYAIRTNDYKLVYFYDPSISNWEFYDLKKDPLEMKNSYSDPSNATIIAGLKEQLNKERETLGINSGIEDSLYAESKTGKWNKELRQYNLKMMAKWKANHMN